MGGSMLLSEPNLEIVHNLINNDQNLIIGEMVDNLKNSVLSLFHRLLLFRYFLKYSRRK